MSNRGTLRAPRCTAGRTLFLWPLLLVLTWPHALQAQNDERILLATCIGEPGSGDTHVSGVVTNSVTGSPITGARIEAVSSDGTVLTETHAQIGGEYRLCKLPSAPGLALRAVFGTNEGASVVIPASGPQFMNLTVSVSDPVTIMGTVLDNGTQQPMEGVWVALSGTRFSTVTNREGKFSFLDVPPGNHVLESNQIGYAFRADSLTLLRHALGLRIALSEQAIVLDPITVTGRRDRNALRDAEIAEYGSTFSSRFLGMTPSEVEEVRHMASSAIDLVARANMPQIRVYDNVPTVLQSIFRSCAGQTRAPRASLDVLVGRARDGAKCAEVFVDDVHIPDSPEYLESISAEDVSHWQFITSLEARTRYGRLGESGVLLIYTRPR